jgi:P-type E1-E2 ATPase
VSARESVKSRQSNKEDSDILKKNFSKSAWKDVKCGDLIFLQDGDHLPADIVFLMSSEENGECFVQTSSLDGERALKNK